LNIGKQIGELQVQAEDLTKQGKYEEAFDKLDQALDLDPDWAWGYKLLAELFELWGDPKEAKRYWKEFQNHYIPPGH